MLRKHKVKAIYGDEAVEVRENVILVDLQPLYIGMGLGFRV